MIEPSEFFKSLADDTRLQLVSLLFSEGELCVCELMEALDESQPKISRHLAHMRARQILSDRRQGQWVYYSVNPNLPAWANTVLESSCAAIPEQLNRNRDKLNTMQNRPEPCC